MSLPGTISKEKEEQAISWHYDKTGEAQEAQEPIELNGPKHEEPGCGFDDDTTCIKCFIFCGNHCGCPSKKKFKIGSLRVLSRVTMGVLVWAFFYSVTFPPCAQEEGGSSEEECVIEGLPGGNIFGILMVFLLGMAGEALIILIPMPCNLPTLPPLLASLLIGIMLRNVPGISVAKYINDIWSTRLRNMALGIILGRAGLEVDKDQMYKLRWVVPRLAFLPCIIESCSYGIVAHWILDLPWEWSFMLGFVCGAVAPACVVPSMIKFQELGYGTEHGVPSLLIAAASLDDIVAINCFNILLTVTFGGNSIWYNIGIAFVEITLGIIFGLIGGYYLQVIPDRRQYNIVRDRTFLLIIFSFFLIFVTDGPLDIAGAGTLGTLTCSFVAAIGWNLHCSEAVAQYFKGIWFYFQPLLFGLTGATVDLSSMDSETVVRALACIVICLTIRLTVAGNSVSFLGWSHKEKLMTSISWIPKATVQAAIGGSALSRVYVECKDAFAMEICSDEHSVNNASIATTGSTYTTSVANYTAVPFTTEMTCYPADGECYLQERYAQTILTVAVLLILTTAPIGVFLIGTFGPRLLPHDGSTEEPTEDTKSNYSKNVTISSSDTGIVVDPFAQPSFENGISNPSYDHEFTHTTVL